MGVLILLLDIFPGIIAKLAEICGIGIPINMIFFSWVLFFTGIDIYFECTGIRFISKD